MFELCRRPAVFGSDRPPVGFVATGIASSGVDHRFDRKAHAGIQSIDTALSIRKMGNRGIQVELLSESMTDVFPHNGKASPMSLRDDRFADGGDGASRCQGVDRHVHAIEGALRHGLAFLGYLADQKRFTLIAVPAVDDGGHIDVDDVAFPKLLFAGNAMTDDFVNARAAAFGIVLISQRSGFVAVIESPLRDHLVDFARRDSGLDVRSDVIHQAGVHAAGVTHGILLTFIEDEFSLLLQHSCHSPFDSSGRDARD